MLHRVTCHVGTSNERHHVVLVTRGNYCREARETSETAEIREQSWISAREDKNDPATGDTKWDAHYIVSEQEIAVCKDDSDDDDIKNIVTGETNEEVTGQDNVSTKAASAGHFLLVHWSKAK